MSPTNPTSADPRLVDILKHIKTIPGSDDYANEQVESAIGLLTASVFGYTETDILTRAKEIWEASGGTGDMGDETFRYYRRAISELISSLETDRRSQLAQTAAAQPQTPDAAQTATATEDANSTTPPRKFSFKKRYAVAAAALGAVLWVGLGNSAPEETTPVVDGKDKQTVVVVQPTIFAPPIIPPLEPVVTDNNFEFEATDASVKAALEDPNHGNFIRVVHDKNKKPVVVGPLEAFRKYGAEDYRNLFNAVADKGVGATLKSGIADPDYSKEAQHQYAFSVEIIRTTGGQAFVTQTALWALGDENRKAHAKGSLSMAHNNATTGKNANSGGLDLMMFLEANDENDNGPLVYKTIPGIDTLEMTYTPKAE